MRHLAAILIGIILALLIGWVIDLVWPDNGNWGAMIAVVLAISLIPQSLRKHKPVEKPE